MTTSEDLTVFAHDRNGHEYPITIVRATPNAYFTVDGVRYRKRDGRQCGDVVARYWISWDGRRRLREHFGDT